MQDEQTQVQASGIFLIGGDNLIEGNSFEDHRNDFVEQIAEQAPKIYNFMHGAYFKSQQAPIVLIKYDTSAQNTVPELTTELDANSFKNNKHMQIEVIDMKFQGSLVQFTSSLTLSHIVIRKNTI